MTVKTHLTAALEALDSAIESEMQCNLGGWELGVVRHHLRAALASEADSPQPVGADATNAAWEAAVVAVKCTATQLAADSRTMAEDDAYMKACDTLVAALVMDGPTAWLNARLKGADHAVEAEGRLAGCQLLMRAADYYIDRLEAVNAGKVVRDLDEAELAYRTRKQKTAAPHPADQEAGK